MSMREQRAFGSVPDTVYETISANECGARVKCEVTAANERIGMIEEREKNLGS